MKHLLFLLPILFLAACGEATIRRATVVTTMDGFALGTYYHVVAIGPDTLRGLERSIDSLFVEIDNSMSIFNPNSLLSRINRSETDSLDRFLTDCITTAAKVSWLSHGAYDVTVKPLTQAWGFATQEQESEPNLDSLLQFVGYDKISIENGRIVKADPRVQIDLNSIAKGYSSDLLAELIRSRGADRYLVEIGGEIVTRGENQNGIPWKVGIEKPIDGNMVPGSQTQAVLSITDKCLATSGNYRNFRYDREGRKIVHSIDPRTGSSAPGNVLSATVAANSCAYADAIGTALMLGGLQKSIDIIQSDPDLWAYIIYVDDSGEIKTWVSPEMGKRIVK